MRYIGAEMCEQITIIKKRMEKQMHLKRGLFLFENMSLKMIAFLNRVRLSGLNAQKLSKVQD